MNREQNNTRQVLTYLHNYCGKKLYLLVSFTLTVKSKLAAYKQKREKLVLMVNSKNCSVAVEAEHQNELSYTRVK